MPTFTLQAPDGRKIDIEAADQATALRGAKEWAARNPPAKRVDAPVTISGTAKAAGSGAAGSFLGFNPQTAMAGVADTAIAGGGALGKFFGADPRQADEGVAALQAVRRRIIPTAQEIQQSGGFYHEPANAVERYANAGGAMAPNALFPGSAPARAAAVVLPAIGQETARSAAEAAGAGPVGQTIAGMAGGMAGGAASGLRTGPRVTATPAEAAISTFARKARPDLPAMQARAAEYRASNIEPTLADVTDESGRGVIRAAASRMTPGRQVAQDFGDKRALDLPDRMSAQAKRVISQDPRNPDEIVGDLVANRKQMADKQYGAVRSETVPLDEESIAALRTDHGREAIAEAARRERNPEARTVLQLLARDPLTGAPPPITVGMADGIARVLFGRAKAAARAGDNTLASFLSDLGDSVRNPAMAAHPGYADAVGNYATESRAMDAARQGEAFLKRNTDEFVAGVGKMSPDEVEIARASARRAVERASGENVGSAPGVAGRIAAAPEQQARNAALLGPDAPALESGMRLEAQAVRNAQDIAPRTGSQTHGRAQDAIETAAAGARTVKHLALGEWVSATISGANLWLKSRGFSDAQAEALVRLATDPKQTGAVMRQLHQAIGRKPTAEFMSQFRKKLIAAGRAPAALTAGVLSAGAARAPQDQQ